MEEQAYRVWKDAMEEVDRIKYKASFELGRLQHHEKTQIEAVHRYFYAEIKIAETKERIAWTAYKKTRQEAEHARRKRRKRWFLFGSMS